MRTKIWIPILLAVFCLSITFAGVANLKYDLNLFEYMQYSMPLSAEEESYLLQRGGITYGVDRSAPPLSFVDEETGQHAGLVVDYMSSLSIELGVIIPCEPLVWSEVISGLESGRIDTADLFPSEERQKTFSFTQPIYVLRGAIAVREEDFERSRISSLTHLGGKRIAVPDDDFAEEYIAQLYSSSPEKPVLIPVSGISDGMRLLADGQADAVAGDETVIDYTLKNMNFSQHFTLLEEPLYEKDVTFAVRKEDHQLLSILNKGILRLKKKDILTKTQEKWFGVAAPIIKDRSSYDLISRIFLVIISAAVLFYYWNAIMRRKIQEKTREIEIGKSNLRNIIDGLHVYLLVVNRQNLILECNSITEQFLNLPRDQILRTPLTRYPVLSAIYDSSTSVSPIAVEDHYYNLVLRELESVPGTTLLTIEDVTEKIISERRLRQQGKMVAVGQLSAGLAHEIRNPLGLIKNYLYIMRRYMTDETGTHAMTVAGESVDRINGLIESLLSFSRLSGDREHLIFLRRLLNSILLLEEKHLLENEIEVDLVCGENLTVFTNEEALKIILFNLLDNAIDAFSIPAEGTAPSLHTSSAANYAMPSAARKLHVLAESREDTLHICIQDNACGIPEEELECIFNPFFTTKDTGTGLGLYIVSSELEKLGGTISVESHLGQGTVFTVTIPPQANHNSHR